jgi:hypothetical protein
MAMNFNLSGDRAMSIKYIVPALVALAVAGNASAVAPGVDVNSGQYSISVSGFVPVVCRASVGATVVPSTGSVVNLGGLNEFCNSPNGYEVYADYAAGLANATLKVDGQKINLSRDGSTRISKSNTAAIATRSIELDLSKVQNANGAISFRIVPM